MPPCPLPHRHLAPRRRAPLLARAALALYPPSWRARYAGEVLALLEDSGGRPRELASVAWRALPAWFGSPRYLRDPSARVRASLSTALMAWSMLAGLALLFAQAILFQGYTAPGYPAVGWAYLAFKVALAVSALVAGLGGLPLWLLMFRRARRERRTRDRVYLLLPVIAPVTYVVGLLVMTHLADTRRGFTPYQFLTLTLAGFATAVVAAAGPGLALRRLRPRGPALRLAANAAGISAAAMAVTAAAIVVAIAGLNLSWFRQGGSIGPIFAIYLVLVAVATAVTTVSAARATRAARARA